MPHFLVQLDLANLSCLALSPMKTGCNRRTLILLSFAFATMTLASCTASGPKLADLDLRITHAPDGSGRIFLYRDASIVGAAVQPKIYLNGTQVGDSKPGGFFFVDVPSGVHVVSARTENEASASVSIREGETIYVRSSIAMGLVVGRIQFTVVHEQEARRVISSLRFTGSISSIPVPEARGGHKTTPGPLDGPSHSRDASSITLDDLDALLPKKP